MEVLVAALILSFLGLVFGVGLAFASKFLKIKADERLEMICKLLPGANCGACGKAGCIGFAEAILSKNADLDGCKVCDQQAKEKIAEILGISYSKQTKFVAIVRCNGGTKVKDRFIYNGIKDCIYANLELGGQKECFWGCLGFGTCANICPFAAISMSDSKIPIVDPKKCTGCGKCVEVCPKKLFCLIPAEYKVYVACSSLDLPKNTKAICPVGCIGCGICTKVVDSAFYVKDNLASIDYKKVKSENSLYEAMKKCPTKCIVERG